ncbi:hypothetical protein [Vibrio sp.]|uniref:hypothetical protein n=1 Tax=Vibrio sp. TaxID=678 RepID=UPI00311FF373
MTKSLCKMNRKQIAEGLSDIHRLVAEPKFVCRSCARCSADKAALCKPASLSTLSPHNATDKQLGSVAEDKSQLVKKVVEQAKQKANDKPNISPERSLEYTGTKEIKRAQKALKKQYKQQKKLLKLAKKMRKLLKREAKLRACLDMTQLSDLKKARLQTSNMH